MAEEPNFDAPESIKVDECVRTAYAALLALTPEQRALVLCWFCWCGQKIPPGRTTCDDGHRIGG